MTERNTRIREAIDSRSSQQKIADALGITRQSVNLRLAGSKDIDSIEFIQAVAKLTGYTFEYLLNGDKIYGVKGDDKLYGVKGDDKLYGVKGDDKIYGVKREAPVLQEPSYKYDKGIVEVVIQASKDQSDLIKLLKQKISELENDVAKYKKQ
jgi:transcriptional regulator with XRE-family HTH domain